MVLNVKYFHSFYKDKIVDVKDTKNYVWLFLDNLTIKFDKRHEILLHPDR